MIDDTIFECTVTGGHRTRRLNAVDAAIGRSTESADSTTPKTHRPTFMCANGPHTDSGMFEPFSSGYYLGRLYVEPHDGESAVMHREQHERVNDQLYEDREGPLVMKIGSTHVQVHGADGVPGRTVALPEPVLPAAGVDNPPALREVLLAKADRAAQLLGIEADGPARLAEALEDDDEGRSGGGRGPGTGSGPDSDAGPGPGF